MQPGPPPSTDEPAADTPLRPDPAPAAEPPLQPDPAPSELIPAAPAPGTRSLAQDLAAGWRDLLELSQPRSWPTTALPFVVAAYDVQRGISPALILGTLYFLGPYNLLLHGIGAGRGASMAPDRPSPTPDDDLTGDVARPDRARLTRVAIAVTNLPFLAALVLLGGATGGLALLLTVTAALAASILPIRARRRPILGSVVSTVPVVLPAVCGSLVAGLAVASLPWLALAALATWAMASYALRANVAIAGDRIGGRTSTATTLGPRPTAMFSLVGYAVAALLAVGLGRLGAFAALGLDLFVLLPAMVLLATRKEPVAVEAAARRAWSGFLGLRWLVGLWLGVLLLRHWGVVAGFSGLDLAIGVSAAAAGYAGWNIVVTRLATRRRRTRPEAEREILSLTIVVPSHDDGERLAVCVEALLEQTYADTRILVVDEGSTDGSPELAAEILGGAGRVIAAPPRPDGWTARSWRCSAGIQASDGDLVMFVDVDTILVPVASRILVEQLENGRWDLLSGVTRYDMPTAGERAGVPGFALLLLGFRPIWLSALTGGRPVRAAFAYRPLMLLRRDAYQASGGHGAVPDSLREDIDLARTFARAGRRVGTVHVADVAASRDDATADAAVRTWRRWFLPSVGGSLALAIVAIAVQVLAFLVPMVLPPLAFISGAEARVVVASCVPLFLLGFARFALVLTQRQPLTTVLWHPVTVGLTLVGQLAGVMDHITGRRPAWRRPDQALATATSSDHRG